MENSARKNASALLGLIGCALVIALLARIGLAVMDATGALGYNYRAATAPYLTDGLSTLDKLPFTLTGGTLVGFVFAGGLALSLACATALVYAHLHRERGGAGSALAWGFASAVAQFACLFIVVLGLYSEVLLSQMTKGGSGSLGVTLAMLLLAVGTLCAAACAVCRMVARRSEGKTGRTAAWALISVAVCGAVVCALVCVCFPAINAAEPAAASIAGSLGLACVANLAMLALACKLSK